MSIDFYHEFNKMSAVWMEKNYFRVKKQTKAQLNMDPCIHKAHLTVYFTGTHRNYFMFQVMTTCFLP